MVESLIKAGGFDLTGIYRSRLLVIYENVLDGVHKNKNSNISGQINLFGTKDSISIPRPQYPDCDKFPERARLMMEKEVAGNIHYRPSAFRIQRSIGRLESRLVNVF